MTATGKVSPRLRVNYFTQKDKLPPIVVSKIFISSLILGDVGPESVFLLQSLPFLPPLISTLQASAAGKRQNSGKFKAFVSLPPDGNQLMKPRKICHLKSPLLACCTWAQSTKEDGLIFKCGTCR